MSTRFAAINLAALSAPEAIETLDYEVILDQIKQSFLTAYNQFRLRNPDLPEIDVLNIESEPLNIAFQVMAYRELLVRQEGNDKYKAATLAYATVNNLENKVAELGVERKVIDVGDPNADPPVPPTYESDYDLRRRAQLAWEALSTAGPKGAYTFHALTADALVKDAAVFGPEDDSGPDPGQVLVVVLSHEDDGTASAELLASVHAYLGDDNRRPLTDQVLVESAVVASYEVEAVVKVPPGASSEEVRQAAEDAVRAYVQDQFGIGNSIKRSRIAAALYVADDTGRSPVVDIEITSPASDIGADPKTAPYCTDVVVTVEVV